MTDNRADDHADGERSASRAADITYEIDDGELPSMAVVRAVSALTDMPAGELDPLYDTMDPDHLDGLFEATTDDALRSGSSVTFHYSGCTVTVTRDTVSVRSGDRTA